MASRDEIVTFANDFLDIGALSGLRADGPAGVGSRRGDEDRVRSLRLARALRASLRSGCASSLLVHHGLFWDKDPRVIDPLHATPPGSSLPRRPHSPSHTTWPSTRTRRSATTPCSRTSWEWSGSAASRTGATGAGWPSRRRSASSPTVVQEKLDRPPLVFSYGPEEVVRVAVLTGGAARLCLRRRGRRATTVSSRARPTSRRSTPRRKPGIHFVAGRPLCDGDARRPRARREAGGRVRRRVGVPRPPEPRLKNPREASRRPRAAAPRRPGAPRRAAPGSAPVSRRAYSKPSASGTSRSRAPQSRNTRAADAPEILARVVPEQRPSRRCRRRVCCDGPSRNPSTASGSRAGGSTAPQSPKGSHRRRGRRATVPRKRDMTRAGRRAPVIREPDLRTPRDETIPAAATRAEGRDVLGRCETASRSATTPPIE